VRRDEGRAAVAPCAPGTPASPVSRPAGRSDRTARRLLAAGAAVASAAVAAYCAAIAAHPLAVTLKGFDLRVYLGGASQALSRPGQLYAWAYDGHPGIRFTYTPFAALLFAAVRALPFTVLVTLAATVSVLALGATVSVAFRELGWRGTPRLGATLLVAGLALWTEPAQRALFLGQVEIVLMAVVTWDLCQPAGRRLAGAATGVAAGVKLVPLLFIVYLLVTRRYRQAAVAVTAFAVTAAAGFLAFPSASVTWWLGGDFLRAGRTGFVGGQQNQSLLGLVARLAGSVQAATLPWLLLALPAAVAGLAAAAALYRGGRSFAGLMTCALTALLVSPVSWDHHWVWIAPGLAVLLDAAVRRPRPGAAPVGAAAWYFLVAVVVACYAAWPGFWSAKAGLLGGGLINYAPASAWAYGDNPAYREYHWHGPQLLAGNLEVIVGAALFVVALAAASRAARRPATLPRAPAARPGRR
jgi:alpha-1,2-mannosyltransferase